MADDPLSSFRQRLAPKPAISPALVVNRPGERVPYEAFAAKDKVVRLDIRCASGLAHAVAYNYLLNVSYNRHTYAEIFLTVSGLTVTIKGRALRPVVDALKYQTCEFVQEFDPGEFLTPSDANAPYIESLTVEVLRGPGTNPQPAKTA